MFSVKEFLQATGGRLLKGKPVFKVPGLSIDSRTIRQGELFVALTGDRFDGHAFLREVLKRELVERLLISGAASIRMRPAKS